MKLRPLSALYLPFLLGTFLLPSLNALGQKPRLLKDINLTTIGSDPHFLTPAGGLLYFTADDSSGHELWVTDGTQNGTRIVKDIYPGSEPSDPKYLTAVDGQLFFFAHSPGFGRELWKSDGTADGTVLVSDIAPGTGSPQVAYPFALGSEMLFSCSNPNSNRWLYRTDGTEAGTYRVISPDSGLSNPGPFFLFQGKAYFNAADDLWSYDPASGQARKVLDFPLYEGHPMSFVEFQGQLFFATMQTPRIYRTDGTGPGTQVVYDFGIQQQSQVLFPVEYNGNLYFTAQTLASGYEFWKTDGTSAGTQMVRDIWPGSTSSYPYQAVVLNGLLYFTAADSANGRELWRSDGTTAGTQMIVDLCPGVRGGLTANIFPYHGKLYFPGDTGDGWELMEYAPQTGEFRLLAEGKTGYPAIYPNSFATFNDGLYFSAINYAQGREIWKTDGTDAGTEVIRDIATPTQGSSVRQFMSLREKAVFAADDGIHGLELWETDGTSTGTRLLKDIYPGNKPSLYREDHAGDEDLVFFAADDGLHGYELWKTDGTLPGTQMVLDLWPGPEGGYLGELSYTLGKAFFFGVDSLHLRELWVSDGTAQGTAMITDVPDSIVPPGMLTYNALQTVSTGAYFTHYYPGAGCELWFTDGTAAGTRFVKDIQPGPGFSNSSLKFGIEHHGIFYFNANDSVHGEELWRTDGTSAGTVLVSDINPNGSSTPLSLVIHNDEIYFLAKTDGIGFELFKTDGTSAGTRLVKDIYPGPQNGAGCIPSGQITLTSTGGLLWFQADDGMHGCEAWVSDGTTDGTVMLKDLFPGGSGKPVDFTPFGDKVYFSASDADHQKELFESDGTAEGTFVSAILNPGGEGNVKRLFSWQEQLFFSATTPDLTDELWTLHRSGPEDSALAPGAQLLLFPNPAQSQITAVWEDKHHGPYDFQVTDLLGRIVVKGTGNKTNDLAGHTFELGALAPGTYILQISEPASNFTQKFVVVR